MFNKTCPTLLNPIKYLRRKFDCLYRAKRYGQPCIFRLFSVLYVVLLIDSAYCIILSNNRLLNKDDLYVNINVIFNNARGFSECLSSSCVVLIKKAISCGLKELRQYKNGFVSVKRMLVSNYRPLSLAV